MNLRKLVFWFHLVCGLVVGSVLVIIASTGVILAFGPQIIERAERKVRHVEASTHAERLSLDDVLTKASQAKPGETITSLTVDSDRQASVFVRIDEEEGFYLDPYTGHVLGEQSKTRQFMEEVEDWHRYLGFHGRYRAIGHAVKEACNVVFLCMVVSGLYLWWPRHWKWPGIKNILFFNPQAKGKARHWNWHNVIGFWCAPFLFIIATTGLVMSYGWANNLVSRIIQPASLQSGSVKDVPRSTLDNSPQVSAKSDLTKQPLTVQALFLNVERSFPGWKAITFKLPVKNGPARVTVKGTGLGTTQVVMDAYTGWIIKSEAFNQQDIRRQSKAWAEYVHTGRVFGILGQLVMGVAALGVLFLIWTGFAMAIRRLFKRS